MNQTQTPKLNVIRFADHRREPAVEADISRIVTILRRRGEPEYIKALADRIEARAERDPGTSFIHQPPESA